MFKVEDIQNYGKEQYETAVATATGLQNGLSAIASAYGDYTKKSYEDTKSFVEKLSGVKSLDKALEAQTEYAKSSYETFMADAQKKTSWKGHTLGPDNAVEQYLSGFLLGQFEIGRFACGLKHIQERLSHGSETFKQMWAYGEECGAPSGPLAS